MAAKRKGKRSTKSQKARDALLRSPGFKRSDFEHEGKFDAVAQRRAIRWFDRFGRLLANPDFTTTRAPRDPEKRRALKRAVQPADLKAQRSPVVVVRTGRRFAKEGPDQPNRIRKVRVRKDGTVRLVLEKGEREVRPIDSERWARDPERELRRLTKGKPRGANRAVRFNYGERFIGPDAEDSALIDLAVTLQESLEDEIQRLGPRTKRGRALRRFAKDRAAELLEAVVFEIPSAQARKARKRAKGNRAKGKSRNSPRKK